MSDIVLRSSAASPFGRKVKIAAKTLGALTDGILTVYEGRYRPAELRHEPWEDYQKDKINRKRPVCLL